MYEMQAIFVLVRRVGGDTPPAALFCLHFAHR